MTAAKNIVGEGRGFIVRLSQALLVILVLPLLFATSAVAGEINACKYLIVTDFTSDPYGIAKELRAQAKAKGFIVISAVSDAPQADVLSVCVMTGSWSANGLGGQVSVRVVDSVGGALVGEAAARGTDWLSVGRTVRKAVEKIYRQLAYTGFDEETYRQRNQRIFPPRPKLAITEDDVRKNETRNPIEGIWTDTEDHYRLGIVPASKGSGTDYVAVVLRSTSPV